MEHTSTIPGSIGDLVSNEIIRQLSVVYGLEIVCLRRQHENHRDIVHMTFSFKEDQVRKHQDPDRRLVLCARLKSPGVLEVSYHGKLHDKRQLDPTDPIHTWEDLRYEKLLEEAEKHIGPPKS